jgi:hypothetical protein
MDAVMRARRARQGQQGQQGAMSGGGGIPELPGLSASRLIAEGGGGQGTPGILARPGGYAAIPRPTQFLPPGDQQSALYQLLHRMLPTAPRPPAAAGPGGRVTPAVTGGGIGGRDISRASVGSAPSGGGANSPEPPSPPSPFAGGPGGVGPTVTPGGSAEGNPAEIEQAIQEFMRALQEGGGTP